MAFFLKLTSGFVLSCVSCVRSFCWHRGMQALQAATISGCQANNAFQGNQSHFHSKKISWSSLVDKCWQDSMQMHGHIFKLETKWTWCAELVGSKVSILPSRNFRVCCRNMSEKKFPARAPMVSNSGPSAHISPYQPYRSDMFRPSLTPYLLVLLPGFFNADAASSAAGGAGAGAACRQWKLMEVDGSCDFADGLDVKWCQGWKPRTRKLPRKSKEALRL